jgi:hypothetical protein
MSEPKLLLDGRKKTCKGKEGGEKEVTFSFLT